MWVLAFIFAIVYALPELTLLIAWSTVESIAYSALFGVAMAVAANRLNGRARAAVFAVCGVIFSFPLPMMAPFILAGLPLNISGLWLGRAIWFTIATALLLVANKHLTKQQEADR